VYDTDSGCSHLGHAIWNLLALHELNHPDEIMDEGVFNKQCEYWKNKKADSTQQVVRVMGQALRREVGRENSPLICGQGVPDLRRELNKEMEWKNLEKLKEQDNVLKNDAQELPCVSSKPGDHAIPAEYCTDDILQENTVIGEIEPAQWQLDEVSLLNRQQGGCRKCGGQCVCKPEPITFEIKDIDKSKSFQMLEKDYIYPAMLKMAKDDDCAWLKAYDDYFQHLEEEYRSKEEILRETQKEAEAEDNLYNMTPIADIEIDWNITTNEILENEMLKSLSSDRKRELDSNDSISYYFKIKSLEVSKALADLLSSRSILYAEWLIHANENTVFEIVSYNRWKKVKDILDKNKITYVKVHG
jgi:hypothetical protein